MISWIIKIDTNKFRCLKGWSAHSKSPRKLWILSMCRNYNFWCIERGAGKNRDYIKYAAHAQTMTNLPHVWAYPWCVENLQYRSNIQIEAGNIFFCWHIQPLLSHILCFICSSGSYNSNFLSIVCDMRLVSRLGDKQSSTPYVCGGISELYGIRYMASVGK